MIADTVQFLGGRGELGGDAPQYVPASATAQANADFGGPADDDIPF